MIIVGTFGPAAASFVKRDKTCPMRCFNVSFVGSQALLEALGPQAEGVIVTQVVPPLDADLPAVEEYRQALAEYAPDATPDFISLEGYLAAKLLPKASRRRVIT